MAVIDLEQWKTFRSTTVQEFVGRFTLHDSGLIAMTLDAMDHLTLEFGFDLAWNSAVPTGFTTLLMRFERPYRIVCTTGAWIQATVADIESVAVDRAERTALLDDLRWSLRAYQGPEPMYKLHPGEDEYLTRTKLVFVNWAQIEILHSAPIRCAIGDQSGNVQDLAMLP
jgi:hypothetical protein